VVARSPGGVGAVEGGTIGAFLAFRVPSHLAVIAVLGYRTMSYWLPTVPGAIAYLRLRHTLGTTSANRANGSARRIVRNG
jgi:uncharacterized protein (TIRG00374 family)